MAQQTMLLRPISVLSGEVSSCFPSDTTTENVYKLVNEAVADDDASYITKNSQTIRFGFDFSKLKKLSEILAARVVFRIKADAAFNMASFFSPFSVNFYEMTNDINYVSLEGVSLSVEDVNVWTTYTYSFTKLSDILSKMKADKLGVFINLPRVVSTQVHLTQIYLEFDYNGEDLPETPILLHLKKSGVWQSVSGEAYKKTNGVWATSTLDELSAGDQIVVVEHN